MVNIIILISTIIRGLSTICLPSLVMCLGPSLSCRFLGYTRNQRIWLIQEIGKNTDFSLPKEFRKTQSSLYCCAILLQIVTNIIPFFPFKHFFYEVQQIKISLDNFNIQSEPYDDCLLYTSPSPRDGLLSRMPSSA